MNKHKGFYPVSEGPSPKGPLGFGSACACELIGTGGFVYVFEALFQGIGRVLLGMLLCLARALMAVQRVIPAVDIPGMSMADCGGQDSPTEYVSRGGQVVRLGRSRHKSLTREGRVYAHLSPSKQVVQPSCTYYIAHARGFEVQWAFWIWDFVGALASAFVDAVKALLQPSQAREMCGGGRCEGAAGRRCRRFADIHHERDGPVRSGESCAIKKSSDKNGGLRVRISA